MLHYNPQHVSSINMPIFRKTNCIITVSGIVTLCKWLSIMPDESSLLSSGILYRACIITASGIITVCKRLYSMPDENRLQRE